MSFPTAALFLLTLPLVTAAVILAVSYIRRRQDVAPRGNAKQPVHRLQSDTAAVQDATVHPTPAAPAATPGRRRRAEEAERHPER